MAPRSPSPAADTHISASHALAYWSSQPATNQTMLGGFAQISHIDLRGSQNFINKLRRAAAMDIPSAASKKSASLPPLELAADCGAGIGRVTAGCLSKVARVVDVVEPVAKFAAAARALGRERMGDARVGDVYVCGLERWVPGLSVGEHEGVVDEAVGEGEGEASAVFEDGGAGAETGPVRRRKKGRAASGTAHRRAGGSKRYDLIWIQWCLGHLTDEQVVLLLRRCARALRKADSGSSVEGLGDGWVCVKENVQAQGTLADLAPAGEGDQFDEEDSSVTRSDASFRALFKKAGMRIVRSETQHGFPKNLGLFPVRMWALQPGEWDSDDEDDS